MSSYLALVYILILFLLTVILDWLFERFPQEALESLSIYLLSVRLTKFYQEVKKSLTEHYSYSAHLSIRAALDRYLNHKGSAFQACK